MPNCEGATLQSQNSLGAPIRPHGFTLVELMVTVAVMGIIAVIAVPSFTNLIRNNRVTSAANEMVALLQTARAAAISNRARVEVCPGNGNACAAGIGNRWIAVMTKSTGGAPVVTVLRETTLSSAITVKASANLAAAANKFTFNPSGFTSVGANTSGTVSVCSAELSGNNAADVSASAGRVSASKRAASAACTSPADN